jgi:hypothetical protein
MKPTPFIHTLCAAFSLACLTSTLAFGTETKPASRADPQGDALLTRNLQAVGGAEALQKITSRRTTGMLERHGNKVPIIRTQKAPNLLLVETRFPRPGTLKQGFDGQVAWVQVPGQTGRRLEGKERAAFADDAWLHPALHIREQYPVRHFLGTRTLEGRTYMVLSLAQKKTVKPELWFFDETTTLVARVERQVDGGPQGEISVVIVLEDYRKVVGVTIPFTIRTKLPTSETVLHVDSVEHNLTLNDSIFQAPF